MGNEVANQAGAKGLSFAVPAHIAARIKAAGGGNIADKQTINQLTFGGKAWTMHINGEKRLLQRANEDGEMENVQTLRVVVIGNAPMRGRDYYEKPWNPADPRGPDCWSTDTRKPSASVLEPQAKSCDACPKSVKGSKVSEDGQEGYACTMFKTLVVIPVSSRTGEPDFTFPALRLKLRSTSIWDKQDDESAAAGWYGWDNYTDLLRANQLDHTAAIITRIRFANVNYPKLQFARGDFLDAEQFDKALARANSEDVAKLLAGEFGAPAQPKGRPLPQDDEPYSEAEIAADVKADREAAEKMAEIALAKAKKIAEARAALAALEAEKNEPPFDDAKPAMTAAEAEVVTTRRTRRTKAEMEAARAAEAVGKRNFSPITGEPMQTETPMPERKKPEPAPPSTAAIVEVPAALSGILGAWGE